MVDEWRRGVEKREEIKRVERVQYIVVRRGLSLSTTKV
jgi:hypothetical protein